MFYEWVAEGAAFGIKAFFALVVFALFVGAVVGVLGIGAKIMGGGNEKQERHRTY